MQRSVECAFMEILRGWVGGVRSAQEFLSADFLLFCVLFPLGGRLLMGERKLCDEWRDQVWCRAKPADHVRFYGFQLYRLN